ncbi:PUA-like domain-containing protein [Mycena vulgaris]|nr:PUA-like domain-containing protein [Mycena vulgaris]
MVRPDPKIHGDILSEWTVPVGLMFADRGDLYDAGVHGHKEAGIFGTKGDDGAFSIVLNQGYEDDDDRGDVMYVQSASLDFTRGSDCAARIYTGEGKGKPAEGQAPKPGQNTQQGPQDMKSPGNAALAVRPPPLSLSHTLSIPQRNVASKLPVRVIRGPDGNVKYSPLQGYRYDGLYYVTRAFMEEGKAGFKMCRFELKRCEDMGQAPLPLHVTGQGSADKYWSPDGSETLATGKRQRSTDNSSNETGRTVRQRIKVITGHKKLTKLSFKKT